MKHLILITSLLVASAIAIYFDWTKVYHPAEITEEIHEQADDSVEVLIQNESNKIAKIESGMIFGSLESFKNANKNLKESKSLNKFISENYVYAGWLVNVNMVTRIYWSGSLYYATEKSYELNAEGYVSPNGLKHSRQVEGNAGSAVALNAVIIIIAFGIFCSIEIAFGNRAEKLLGDLIDKSSIEFPIQVPRKNNRAKIIYWKNTQEYFVAYGKYSLGCIRPADYSSLQQFIKKMGKKSKLDWFDMAMTGYGLRHQANIDYNVLLAGYLLFKRDKKGFDELVNKARNASEFLSVSGIIP